MAIATLKQLDDWKLKDEDQDIRGKTLKGPDGRPLGRIRDFLVNTDTERVETIVLDDGSEYRVRDIEIRDDSGDVFLRASAGAPPRETRGEDTIRVPVVEENVQVGKRSVVEGGVRVTSEIKEEPVDEKVTLRRTEVHVDRRDTDRPATEDDIRKAGETIEALETSEEPAVRKNTRVVEEIVITKKARDEERPVHDKARRTEVHVEDLGTGKDRKAS